MICKCAIMPSWGWKIKPERFLNCAPPKSGGAIIESVRLARCGRGGGEASSPPTSASPLNGRRGRWPSLRFENPLRTFSESERSCNWEANVIMWNVNLRMAGQSVNNLVCSTCSLIDSYFEFCKKMLSSNPPTLTPTLNLSYFDSTFMAFYLVLT